MQITRRLLGPLSMVAALLVVATSNLTVTALAAERPSWHSLPLTNARTGESFTLADLAGKTVYVEPMATWCTNCRMQMRIIRDQVKGQVDPDRVMFLGLSVETEIAPETLATYVDQQGFDWTFAVMSPELLQALATEFGRTIANPPAIPHFLVSPDGTTSGLSTGLHTADALLAQLSAAEVGAQP